MCAGEGLIFLSFFLAAAVSFTTAALPAGLFWGRREAVRLGGAGCAYLAVGAMALLAGREAVSDGVAIAGAIGAIFGTVALYLALAPMVPGRATRSAA